MARTVRLDKIIVSDDKKKLYWVTEIKYKN